jgi:hypothetical protein
LFTRIGDGSSPSRRRAAVVRWPGSEQAAAHERFRHQRTAGPHDRLGDQTQLRDQPVLAAEEQGCDVPRGRHQVCLHAEPKPEQQRHPSGSDLVLVVPRDHVAGATPERRNDAAPRHRKWQSA